METEIAFKKWSDFVRRSEIDKTPTTNRFIARFKLASRFKGIDAEDFTKETLQGYSALMVVFLSYTAFEALIEAVNENQLRSDKKLSVDFKIEKYAHPMDDFDLQERIRENEKLLNILIDYTDVKIGNSTQIERLMSFYLGDGGLQ